MKNPTNHEIAIMAGELAVQEVAWATDKFPEFNSAHEGYAVILEELDELWTEVKGNSPSSRLYEEAVQVAAMAIRFMTELTPGDVIAGHHRIPKHARGPA